MMLQFPPSLPELSLSRDLDQIQVPTLVRTFSYIAAKSQTLVVSGLMWLMACRAGESPHEMSPSPEPSPATTTSVTPNSHDHSSPLHCEASDGVQEIPPDSLQVDCRKIARLIPTGKSISDSRMVQQHLRLEDTNGNVLKSEFAPCLYLPKDHCNASQAAFYGIDSQVVSAILIESGQDAGQDPSGLDIQPRLQDAISRYVQSRPPNEAIGIYTWNDEVRQIVSPTTDRIRILHRLQAFFEPKSVPRATPIGASKQNSRTEKQSISEAVDELKTWWSPVYGAAFQGFRQIIVLAPTYEQSVNVDVFEGNAYVEILSPESAIKHVRATTFDTSSDFQRVFDETSARLDEALDSSNLVFRYCASTGQDRLRLNVYDNAAFVDLTFPLLSPINDHPPCESQSTSTADLDLAPKLPKKIILEMSVLERIEYDSRLAKLSKEPFSAHLFSDRSTDALASPVTLKLRGNNSLQCDRKSYALKFDDGQARYWLDGSATRKFMLISMCLDDHYLQQYTANQLMTSLDLFSIKFRMVELVISGESKGVYLLLEHPNDELLNDQVRVQSILRRRADREDEDPEVKYSITSTSDALVDYEDFLSTAESMAAFSPSPQSESALADWLDSQMDLAQYLRWVALMSLLSSGDFVDEVYFSGTETISNTGEISRYWTLSAWDQDDLFSPCRNDGEFAFQDPHQLVYCAQSRLDQVIFADPILYDRYVDTLEDVLNTVNQAKFDSTLSDTRDNLLDHLSHPEILIAMSELLLASPNATEYSIAEQEIRQAEDKLQLAFAQRREFLLNEVNAYRMKKTRAEFEASPL